MKDKFTLCSVLVVALVLGWGSYHRFFSPAAEERGDDGRTVRGKLSRARFGAKRGDRVRNGRSVAEQRDSVGPAAENRVRERPNFDDVDEAELTELQKAILAELRAAFDRNDLKAVRRAVARFRMPKSEGGLGGDVPKVLRQRAVASLGWFGAAGIPDLLDFMADVDPVVEEEAFTQFELALDDWEMGDRERAQILVSAMSALNDSERIDSLLMNLNNMRNSVKADTILSILSSGTAEAKALMQEQIGFFTDADVETTDDLETWWKANPDDPGDEEFYGPQKE